MQAPLIIFFKVKMQRDFVFISKKMIKKAYSVHFEEISVFFLRRQHISEGVKNGSNCIKLSFIEQF
jgi:hypothetical protein